MASPRVPAPVRKYSDLPRDRAPEVIVGHAILEIEVPISNNTLPQLLHLKTSAWPVGSGDLVMENPLPQPRDNTDNEADSRPDPPTVMEARVVKLVRVQPLLRQVSSATQAQTEPAEVREDQQSVGRSDVINDTTLSRALLDCNADKDEATKGGDRGLLVLEDACTYRMTDMLSPSDSQSKNINQNEVFLEPRRYSGWKPRAPVDSGAVTARAQQQGQLYCPLRTCSVCSMVH